MYQRIAVAVDESDAAMRAVREAVALARAGGGELLIVHAGPPDDGMERAAGIAERAGLRPETRTVEGRDVGGGIVAEARRWRADLVVVGTHGRRGVKRLMLGSVAEAVARRSEVPVLLVRRGSIHGLPG